MNSEQLRALLSNPVRGDELCRSIVSEFDSLTSADDPNRWFFFMAQNAFASVISNPDLTHAVIGDPYINGIFEMAERGINAIDAKDDAALIACANALVSHLVSMRLAIRPS